MRIACVNQDPGISPERAKGAAVHLRAMRGAFAALGVRTLALDEPNEALLVTQLELEHAREPFDGVYERYALGKGTGSRFARARGLPHVLEVNAPLAEEEERWRSGSAASTAETDAEVFAHATCVVAVSSLVARYAGERGARQEAVVVFPNGVDVERFRPRAADERVRRRLVPGDRVALGFHGRLRPWHGFEETVRAAQRLLQEGVDLHLVLAGSGPFEELLEGLVPTERVTRVPWVSHEHMPAIVASFDLLPLSYSPEHPCYFSPLKLAEAMACGVVPVVPALGDLPELVRDGTSGRVFRPGDNDALTAALRELARDPAERARLARGARAAAHELSWERIARFVRDALRGAALGTSTDER